MRITLKQSEIQAALVAYVAGLGVGGEAVQSAQVVFNKGRKGNGLSAEIVIGESVEEVEAEAADEAETTETAANETVTEAVTETAAAPTDSDVFA